MINNMEEARLKVLQVKQNRKTIGKELLKILGLFALAELMTGIFIQTTWDAYKTPLDLNNLKSILIQIVIPAGWAIGLNRTINAGCKSAKKIWFKLSDNRKTKKELKENNYTLKMSYK